MAILVYITCSSTKEAENIAITLVEQKLAACVNILPTAKSIYSWENKVQKADEIILLAKTIEDTFELLQKKVKELHSYEVPCIIGIPINYSNPLFTSWIKQTLED